jgi:hypothetical protein
MFTAVSQVDAPPVFRFKILDICRDEKSPKYHMKMLLGDFNAKVVTEDIFKPATGNENGLRAVNFATSKNLTVKSTMLPH